jgi:hypothetical protein
MTLTLGSALLVCKLTILCSWEMKYLQRQRKPTKETKESNELETNLTQRER